MEKDELKAIVRLLLKAYEQAYRDLLVVNEVADMVPNSRQELLLRRDNPILQDHVQTLFGPLYLALDRDDAQELKKALLDMPTKGPPI